MGSHAWWFEAEEAARRALRARVPDAAHRDDLVQETLIRLLAVRDRLDDDALVPYAIVTARNLAVSEHRRRRHEDAFAVLDGHAGRAVDEGTVSGEEGDALHVALMRFAPADRDLLVDRDVHGVGIDQLAARERTSVGAMRARLSRLRSHLRLEYTLALRGIDVFPTEDCRAVLRALAGGDAAKARAVSAREHVEGCVLCAELEPAVGQRRRWLAGIVAFVGLDRAAAAVKTHPLVSSVAGVGTVAAAAVAVGTFSGGDAPATVPPPVVSAAPATTTVLAPAPPQVLVDGGPWAGGLPAAPGVTVRATDLTVARVTDDEAFVAHDAAGAGLAVQLSGAGESPYAVRVGDRVTFDGLVAEVPAASQPPGGFTVRVDFGALQVRPAA